jgi:hypothetical protein
MKFELHHGDCLDVLKTLADCSVDAIVTDPPYGLSFMGKRWDYDVPTEAVWVECLRVLKPGGHLLAFAGTRTQHRMAVRIEDAGFEIRDMIAWVYGSGFPKSLDVSKAIDKRGGAAAGFEQFRDAVRAAMKRSGVSRSQLQAALDNHMLSHYLTAGSQPAVPNLRDYRIIRDTVQLGADFDGLFNDEAEREVVGKGSGAISTRKDLRVENGTVWGAKSSEFDLTAPATEAAKQWEGWGTAIKPSLEPITLARKPLIGTVAANVLEHGTGGLNIGACRVGTDGATKRSHQEPYGEGGRGDQGGSQNWRTGHKIEDINAGRWPANFIHDNSEEVLALFPNSNGSGAARTLNRGQRDDGWGMADEPGLLRDAGSGSAARFFYCAKASRDDRDEGCGALELTEAGIKNDSGRGFSESDPMAAVMRHNPHPTVKPTDLMRYLCRLITPPGGIVLDPFMGSGSTGKAAMAEGFRFIGIEREAEYIEIARARISAEAEKPRQLSLF